MHRLQPSKPKGTPSMPGERRCSKHNERLYRLRLFKRDFDACPKCYKEVVKHA